MNSATSHIIWAPDPILLQIGPIAIRWYSLCFLTAFLVGYKVMVKVFKAEGRDPEAVESLFTYMFFGTLVGARLGHCLFYEPGYYLANPIEILKVWRGGLASHGAALGMLGALYFFSKKHQESYFWTISRTSLSVVIGGAFVRLGNFFNSEILGKASDLPWAIVFSKIDDTARHPSMLYEAIAYLGIFFFLQHIHKKQNYETKPSHLFGLFLILLFGARFLIEFTKEPQVVFESSMLLNMGQLLSIPAIIAGLYLLRSKRF